MKLKGKVAIVTGAGSGIGRAIAETFATEGAKVVVSGHHTESCDQTVAEINNAKGTALAVAADVSQEADVTAMVQAAVDKFGRLDILVNNAGVAAMGSLEEMAETDWDKVIDTDLKGVFLGMKHALPAMEKVGRGKIVNIASIAGLTGFAQAAAYGAAKGGVITMTKDAAVEYAAKSINVNAIAPGIIRTKMTEGYLKDPQFAEMLQAQTPYPRLGEVADIAAGALYLTSDDADFVTGATLVIDGGWLAK